MELRTVQNEYGDLCITSSLPTAWSDAKPALEPVLAAANRGVWLRVPLDTHAQLVSPLLTELGCTMHHVRGNVATLQYWSPRAPAHNPTPPYHHTAVGAGAVVVDGRGRVLGIRERFDASGKWNLPGGHVDEGESWITSAVRECREEAGVAAVPLGILALRERHMRPPTGPSSSSSSSSSSSTQQQDVEAWERYYQSTRFGSTHIGVLVLCAAYGSSVAPAPDAGEIAECEWLDAAAWAAQGHEYVSLLLAAAAEEGTLQAAAAYARSLEGASPVGSAGSAGSESQDPVVPAVTVRGLLHATHVTATQPAAAAAATRGDAKKKTTQAVFYHAFSRSTLDAAVAAQAPFVSRVLLPSHLHSLHSGSGSGGQLAGAWARAAATATATAPRLLSAAVVIGLIAWAATRR